MRIWTFILLSSALLCIKLVVDYLVPDTPIEASLFASVILFLSVTQLSDSG